MLLEESLFVGGINEIDIERSRGERWREKCIMVFKVLVFIFEVFKIIMVFKVIYLIV